jgi:tetratricopeptide (TPR) repeat protein
LKQFRLALRIDPDNVNARFDLAKALARSGKLDEAIQNFRQSAAEFPGNARLEDDLGELLARGGRVSEALEHFNKAIALDPSDDAARKHRDLVASQIAGR